MERCRREIVEISRKYWLGNSDLEGLLLAFSDWIGELRVLDQEK